MFRVQSGKNDIGQKKFTRAPTTNMIDSRRLVIFYHAPQESHRQAGSASCTTVLFPEEIRGTHYVPLILYYY